MIVVFFALQGAFGAGGMHVQYPAYLVGPVLAYLATSWQIPFAIPMLIGTMVGCVSLILSILLSPETRGKELVADLVIA